MFVFIRTDLPVPQQLVQSNHATFKLTQLYPCGEATPNLVLIGVPDARALGRVSAKLKACQLPHYEWHEPDWELYGFDHPFTAIATAPLDEREKEALRNYRLYSVGGGAGQCQLPSVGNHDAHPNTPEPAQAGLQPEG